MQNSKQNVVGPNRSSFFSILFIVTSIVIWIYASMLWKKVVVLFLRLFSTKENKFVSNLSHVWPHFRVSIMYLKFLLTFRVKNFWELLSRKEFFILNIYCSKIFQKVVDAFRAKWYIDFKQVKKLKTYSVFFNINRELL